MTALAKGMLWRSDFPGLASIGLYYAAGATIGALLKLKYELLSLLLPIALLIFLAMANLFRPTALQARGENP